MDTKDKDVQLVALLARLEELSQSVERQQQQIGLLRQEIKQIQTQNTQTPPVPVVVAVAEPVRQPAERITTSHPLPPVATSLPRLAASERQSLEQYIGGNLINKIGILILVLGVGIFLNYAFENNLVGPVTRITLGYVAGVALLGLAYWLRKNYQAYSAVLLSGGVSTLYFTTYMAYDFYALLPHLLAFTIMVAVTVFTIYAAMVFNQQVIGVYGLVGAYAVPLLLSQNNGQVAVLFTYVAIINVGIAVVAFRKNWPAMNITAFIATWLTYGSWFFLYYQPALHLSIALSFGIIFFALFYVVFAFALWAESGATTVSQSTALLVSNTFIFYLMGYASLQGSAYETWQGLFTLVVAAIHGSIAAYTRSRQTNSPLFFLASVLAITFLSIAVVVQFEGVTITYVWSAEAVVLYAVGQRTKMGFYNFLSVALVALSSLSLVYEWGAYSQYQTYLPFLLNRYWAAAVWVVASQLLLVWLARRRALSDVTQPQWVVQFWQQVLPVVSAVLFYSAFGLEIDHYFEYQIMNQVMDAKTSIPWTEYGRILKQLWSLAFSAVYVAAIGGLTLRVTTSPAKQVAVVILGIVVLSWWLLNGLAQAETVRDAYWQRLPAATFQYLLIRYLIYIGLGVCLIVLEQLVRPISVLRPAPIWKWFPAVTHVFIIALLSAELVQLFVWTIGGELEVRKQLAQKVGFSVLWGGYSLVLVVRGIWQKRRVLRLLGIILFGVTLGKLFLFDLANISTLSKIIAFVGLGVLLLIISFLYQKFKDVILAEDAV